jgi:tRNA pseudouridine32 synthase/23S rRNA pseudouridine746 synthase
MPQKNYSFKTKENSKAAQAIAEGSGLSVSLVKKLMTNGSVWMSKGKKTSRLRSHKRDLLAGTAIEVYYDEKILTTALDTEPTLIHDTKNYSVWYKPSGWLSQGTKYGDKYSVLRFSEIKFKNAFLIHRLDREVSGLIVIAKNSKTAGFLSKNWNSEAHKKTYQAIALGSLESSPGEKIILDYPIDGKESKTQIDVIKTEDGNSFLEIVISTGRKHQIRRHLDMHDFPIIGDPVYGDGNKNSEGIKLVATGLTILDPTKSSNETISFEVPEEYKLF